MSKEFYVVLFLTCIDTEMESDPLIKIFGDYVDMRGYVRRFLADTGMSESDIRWEWEDGVVIEYDDHDDPLTIELSSGKRISSCQSNFNDWNLI